MPDKKSVILSIETKAREFPGKVLLSATLAERGYSVVMTNKRSVSVVKKYDAFLYIDRNSFVSREMFFKRLKINNTKILCIDEEGIVWLNEDAYKKRIHAKTNRYVDAYCAWGSRQAVLIKEVDKRIRVSQTGNPRIDLLRKELRALYEEKARELRSCYSDYILFVSNLASTNNYYSKEYGDQFIDYVISEKKRQGMIGTREEEAEFREYLANRKELFDRFVALLKKVSKDFGDRTIIIRPHPSENHDTWKEIFKSYPNVKVLYEGELTPWIIGAGAVLHNSCTTGVEAALLGLKSIAYVPLDDERFEAALPNSISSIARTDEEAMRLIAQAPVSQEIPEVLHSYISSIEGAFAVDKIIDEVEALEREAPKRRGRLGEARIRLEYLALKITKILGKVTDKDKQARQSYKKQKLEKISAQEAAQYLEKYVSITGRFSSVRIEDTEEGIRIWNQSPTP